MQPPVLFICQKAAVTFKFHACDAAVPQLIAKAGETIGQFVNVVVDPCGVETGHLEDGASGLEFERGGQSGEMLLIDESAKPRGHAADARDLKSFGVVGSVEIQSVQDGFPGGGVFKGGFQERGPVGGDLPRNEQSAPPVEFRVVGQVPGEKLPLTRGNAAAAKPSVENLVKHDVGEIVGDQIGVDGDVEFVEGSFHGNNGGRGRVVYHTNMSDPAMKFSDPQTTAGGDPRAVVPFTGLETLWFNTGSLCNLTCEHCYMESSPSNDTLVYLTRDEMAETLDSARESASLRQVGFTGGEPFMNPEMIPMLDSALETDLEVLVLTNAMTPMRRREAQLLDLLSRHGDRLVFRVSLDHHTREGHDAERGAGGFDSTLEGMAWLTAAGARVHCAGRSLLDEPEAVARQGYTELFSQWGVVLAEEPSSLVIFPEMNAADLSPPEITTGCWEILGKDPVSVMCSSSRMVVKRRGAAAPSVVRCTLLPYDDRFDSGPALADSFVPTPLNHVYCAQFCVLGGASCG